MQVDDAGQTFGIAYHDRPKMLMHRGGLIEDPAERAGFASAHGRELGPPETWEEFVQVVHWFNRPDEGLAASLAGYPDEHNNVYDFLVLLWATVANCSTNATFQSSTRLPVAKTFASRWISFTASVVVLAECLEHASIASGNYCAAGRSAMWNWSGFSAVTELPSSATHGRGRLGLIPRSNGRYGAQATLNVYWLIAMARGTANPAAAWSFMRHLATPQMDRVTAVAGGTATRLSTWRDDGIEAKYPVYPIAETAHVGAPPIFGVLPADQPGAARENEDPHARASRRRRGTGDNAGRGRPSSARLRRGLLIGS